jgi:hypothetical protein
MNLNQPVLAAMLAAGLIGAAAAEPIQTPAAPKAVDIGTLATADNSTLTVTVPMKLRDPEQLNLLLQAVYTPGDPQFHHFLSKQEFAQRFGPDDETVARLTRHFQSQGWLWRAPRRRNCRSPVVSRPFNGPSAFNFTATKSRQLRRLVRIAFIRRSDGHNWRRKSVHRFMECWVLTRVPVSNLKQSGRSRHRCMVLPQSPESLRRKAPGPLTPMDS